MDRTRPPAVERGPAMRTARAAAIDAVLPPLGRERRESRADAADRRAVLGDAVLRQPEAGPRAGRQSQARAAVDATHGNRGDLPEEAHDLVGGRAQDLPVFTAKCGGAAPDQVWSTDITYVPLRHGFLYLVAVMDWYSRHVLAWRLSNTLDGGFCLEALDESLSLATPEIFNSDQGCQFTAAAFTSRLEARGVAVSMDGRGRALDNVFVERLWRSVKYEEVYLRDYADGWEAQERLAAYFRFYSHQRIHQALEYRTPAEVYADRD
jgi:putative transposase